MATDSKASTAPSLNDIALFVEVAKHKNFTRAAHALNMPAKTRVFIDFLVDKLAHPETMVNAQ